jgi:hypothetical protein
MAHMAATQPEPVIIPNHEAANHGTPYVECCGGTGGDSVVGHAVSR